MSKETFIKMTGPFRRNAYMARSLHIINEILSKTIMLAYPVLIIYLFVVNKLQCFTNIVVPFLGFVFVTIFRKVFNRQRPYEKFDMPPVIPKEKKGQSFPSRHVFSAFIIACAFYLNSPLWMIGAALFVFAFIIAVIRVVAGVHFISDVLVGALFAVGFAYIGFCLF